MHVRAVSFDADGTLWDFAAVMRHALGIVLDQLRTWYPGPALDALTIEEMIRIRDDVAEARSGDWSKLEDIRHEALVATLSHVGADTSRAGELNDLYLRHRFEDVELFSDVLPCLDAVASQFPVGLLSNGNSYPERCGLAERLAFVVFAQDHRVAKPDPRLFHVAAEQAGCAIEHLVHVGDGEADVVGARRAGCTSVLIARRDPPAYAELADHVIADLRELPMLLASS